MNKALPPTSDAKAVNDLARLIAFYLPQFHPIPENDEWWGRGFTEWTNVGKARPVFDGHYQPRLPSDLGYYDLRLPEVREAQAQLARQYGIHGFCYYHYWFNGRHLLERPVNEILDSGKPDFPFCLCWANENWTRAWDGLERQVLIKQEYRSDDDLEHIRWLARAFRDPRYIRVNGKPLFLVYRVGNLPDPMQTVSIWREEAQKLGVGDIFLAAVESRVGGAKSIDPKQVGFDAAVEFQPDGLHFPKPIRKFDEYGGLFDYSEIVENMLKKPGTDYLRFPCVTPGWDNSARRKQNPTIITGSSPELYERWLGNVLSRQTTTGDQNLVFVNAWNEWAEGAYLEPDQAWGHAYLEATRRALESSRARKLAPVIELPLVAPTVAIPTSANKAGAVATGPKLSVCIPVYNGEKHLEDAIRSVLNQTCEDFELLVVDDCSPRDQTHIIRKFKDPRLKYSRNEIRQGLVGNWNRCLDLASGEHVTIFHQDDVMLPDNLRRKVEMLDRHPALGYVYSDVSVVEADLSIRLPRWFTPTEPNIDTTFNGRDYFEKLLLGENLICCPSVVVRRSCYEQAGRFNPQLSYTADWEMWLKLAVHFDVGYVSAPLLQYRIHDANETHRFKGLQELEQYYRAKMLALSGAHGRLENIDTLRRRVSRELSERILKEMESRASHLSAKDAKAWLSLASETHGTSLDQSTFQAASEWFLAALERGGVGGLLSSSASSTDTAGSGKTASEWSPAQEDMFRHAKHWEATGKPLKALALLERLTVENSKSSRAWFQLARLQMLTGRFAEADKSLSMIISANPASQKEFCEALTLRGRARESMGRMDEAMGDFSHAANLALMSERPDVACELDEWMGALAQGRRIPAATGASKEQIQKYAPISRLAQALGKAAGRRGPISTFEMDQALPVWNELLAGRITMGGDGLRFEGREAVIAAMTRLHLQTEADKRDLGVQQQVQQAWKVLTALTRPNSIPAELRQAVESMLPESPNDEVAVSIIIPTFNRLDLTKQCLASLAASGDSTVSEIVVVDNASTDGPAEFLKVLESEGKVRALLNRENAGFARACNQGARAALGKHLLFLNNDTEVRPGWLDELQGTLVADERVVAVGSKLLFPDGTVQHAGVAILDDRKLPDPLVARHIHYRKPADSPEVCVPRLYQALTSACMLVRKSDFDKIHGYDEEFWNGYEDIDLCFRLATDGGLLVYQPRSVVVHHESQSGPERFRKVGDNIQLLHRKWIGKIKPDYVVSTDGAISKTSSGQIRPYVTGDSAQAMDAPMVSIIVLVHNQLDHTRLCWESLKRHTSLPHEVVFVDNASTDGAREYLQELAASHASVRVIRNESNLGFAAGNNQGLAIARGDCVVLLNNDTVVTPGWIERMISALQSHPDIGIAGPMTNYIVGPQLVEKVGYKDLDGLPAFAAEWGRGHAGQIQKTSRAVGFCLMARRSVIDRIGGLDEQFGSGNFEDDDFCLRAGLAGFGVVIAKDVFIHHTGSQTFKGAKIDYRSAMLANWEKFKMKWGLPKHAPIEKGYPTSVRLAVPSQLKSPLPQPSSSNPSIETGSATPAVVRTLPEVARLGGITNARDLLGKGELNAAWEAGIEAVKERPFHPEAYLVMAEVARAAGDAGQARTCAERAKKMAPDWKPARQFLKGLSTQAGVAKVELSKLGTVLPPTKTPRLSVCLIVRNEERFLADCLKSIRDIAHQIVVVDTGSTDRTVEIAREHGAEVHDFAWCDDFSAARNVALAHARGDWVLSLDADEELSDEGRKSILKETQNEGVMAYRLPIVDCGRESDGCNYVPRLFRNAPGVHFAGRVHEHVFESVESLRKTWGLDNRLGTSRLLHHGYQSDVTLSRDKIARNRGLLELAVSENPADPNLQMNLGLELVRSGEVSKGIEHYQVAFNLLSAMPAAGVSPELREALLTQLSTHLMANHRASDVIAILQSPLARAGGLTASLHFSLGLALMEARQHESASEHMRQCIAKRNQPTLTPINGDIRKAGPNHCLGRCLQNLKQFEPAQKAYEAALKDEPGARRVRLDMARLFVVQDHVVDALKLLNEMVSEKADDADVWICGGEAALSNPAFLEFACDWTREAVKHVPQHNGILGQRAEALLLSGDTKGASAIWKSLASAGDPSAMAALVLCETARKGKMEAQVPQGSEKAASHEFLKWYRKLLGAEAVTVVTALNDGVQRLAPVLPTAAGALTAVLSEAGELKEQIK